MRVERFIINGNEYRGSECIKPFVFHVKRQYIQFLTSRQHVASFDYNERLITMGDETYYPIRLHGAAESVQRYMDMFHIDFTMPERYRIANCPNCWKVLTRLDKKNYAKSKNRCTAYCILQDGSVIKRHVASRESVMNQKHPTFCNSVKMHVCNIVI